MLATQDRVIAAEGRVSTTAKQIALRAKAK